MSTNLTKALAAANLLEYEDLAALNRLVVDRLKTMQKSAASSAALKLKVGDKGILRNMRGKWNNQAVLVQQIRGSKALVETIQSSHKDAMPQLVELSGVACGGLVPAHCVDVYEHA